jgi:uncharacterized membrane protein
MDHATLEVALVVFNVAVMVVSALIGWFVRSLMDRVKEMEAQNKEQLEKLADLRTELPTHYVRRDDFKELADSLFTLLRRIEDKLERKADRP